MADDPVIGSSGHAWPCPLFYVGNAGRPASICTEEPGCPAPDVPEGTEIPFKSDGSFGLPTEGVLVIRHMPRDEEGEDE
jgi:hypothetical protein